MLLRPLNQVLQLHYLLVLPAERKQYLIVLIAQTCNHHLLLLEAFLDDSDFLRIGKRILASDNLLKLGPEASALVYIELHLYFNLGYLGRLDVSLQSLDLIGL